MNWKIWKFKMKGWKITTIDSGRRNKSFCFSKENWKWTKLLLTWSWKNKSKWTRIINNWKRIYNKRSTRSIFWEKKLKSSRIFWKKLKIRSNYWQLMVKDLNRNMKNFITRKLEMFRNWKGKRPTLQILLKSMSKWKKIWKN